MGKRGRSVCRRPFPKVQDWRSNRTPIGRIATTDVQMTQQNNRHATHYSGMHEAAFCSVPNGDQRRIFTRTENASVSYVQSESAVSSMLQHLPEAGSKGETPAP